MMCCIVRSLWFSAVTIWRVIQTRDRPKSFFESDTDIFKKNFTDICPAANIQLSTNTDIPKFAYRYFNKYFG